MCAASFYLFEGRLGDSMKSSEDWKNSCYCWGWMATGR